MNVHAARDVPTVEAEAAKNKGLLWRNGSPFAAENPAAPPASQAQPPLPQPVAEMREAILAAVRSGRIEDLATPLQWNELLPEIADAHIADPIAYWKALSGDGEGREILAMLARIIDSGPALEPLGPDVENNGVFVWPYLAALDLDKLTPAQQVDLYRLMSPAEAKAMRAARRWTWWRLSISADGTWLSFRKEH